MSLNDSHTTDGHHYRTPAHPEMVSALGRAIWNFASLEESIVAILFEGRHTSLTAARSMSAGGKEKALGELAEYLVANGGNVELIASLEAAQESFGLARSEIRNVLAHAHPFLAGHGVDGEYLPGLAHTKKSRTEVVAWNADDLHEFARRIEAAIDPIADARLRVQRHDFEVNWN